MKLKIVSLGYFGHSNAGDDLLRESISNLFADHDILFSSWFPGIDLINSADLLIVGGGSIWPGHTVFQHAEKLANRLKVPLFVVGISAKFNTNDDVKNANVKLIEYADFFHVRDKASYEIFRKNSKVTLGTDLFWWTKHCSDEIPSIAYNQQVALNLRSWDSDRCWSPEGIYKTIQNKGLRINPWPFYYGSRVHESGDNPTDFELLATLSDTPPPSSFSLKPLESSSFSICMRFHGIQVSVRAKKPVIGFDYHKKTKAFYQENNIEELCVPLGDEKALANAVSLLLDNFDEYKSTFENIRHKLLIQGEKDKELIKAKLKLIKPNNIRANRLRNIVKKTLQLLKLI